jgi:hypothetical protein
MGQALFLQPPVAAGFEDEDHVAPLNQRVRMPHCRGAKEIYNIWSQSSATNLAVFYFFKTRKYCKFDVNDSQLRSRLGAFVYSIANDYYFTAIEDRALIPINPSRAVDNVGAGHVILVSTEREHKDPPLVHLWEYVCSFDPKTGKRQAEDKGIRPEKMRNCNDDGGIEKTS